MVPEVTNLRLDDGRTLHVYDTGAVSAAELPVFWHHGTPNLGAPPEPLFAAAAQRGIRWLGYDRPSYGGSTPLRGRNLAAAAADVRAVADALGIGQLAVMGHSGGSAHALACAALLPQRVLAAVCVAGLSPFDAEGLDWFSGMAPAGVAQLRAALRGRAALEQHLSSSEFDPEEFTPEDHAALAGAWAWFGKVAGLHISGGLQGMVDDNLAYVAPWGFDPRSVQVPVLFLHGAKDRVAPSSHARWLERQIGSAQLWLRPDDGHISVLNAAVAALDWLGEQATRRAR